MIAVRQPNSLFISESTILKLQYTIFAESGRSFATDIGLKFPLYNDRPPNELFRMLTIASSAQLSSETVR